jgi:hypothetical protein
MRLASIFIVDFRCWILLDIPFFRYFFPVVWIFIFPLAVVIPVCHRHFTWLLKSIKINSSRWNQETPLAAQETPEFHQEGNFPCHSPAVKDIPWIAVSDGACRAPFLPSVSTRQRF